MAQCGDGTRDVQFSANGKKSEAVVVFWLASDAFDEGAMMPRKYTCDGQNISPPLAWSDPPPGTRSLVLVCLDLGAPREAFHHWAVYDIPPEQRELPEDFSGRSQMDDIREAMNDFGTTGYSGPCPPRGSEAHAYHFLLKALRAPRTVFATTPDCRDVMNASAPNVIQTAELVTRYAR